MSYDLSFKPAALNEIRALPDDQATMILEKLTFLTANPHPDGASKKKLQIYQDIYRLRAGRYRVFYCYGANWIRVLGVRLRSDDTYRASSKVPFEQPANVTVTTDSVDLDVVNASLDRPRAFEFDTSPAAPFEAEHTLTEPPTPELLVRLRIPPEHWTPLLACRTEEALLSAPIPAPYLERLIDVLFPRPIEQVIDEPDLLVKDPSDLLRFKDGELLAFLLRLDPEQERYISRSLKGPTLIKGGAGTGKSTVALYRIKHLLDHPKATGNETVLFATYTQTLETVTQQLLEQLLSPEQLKRVTITTVDKLVHQIMSKSGRPLGEIESGGAALARLKRVRAQFQPTGPSPYQVRQRALSLSRLSDRYLLDEFDWVITGRGLTTLDAYLVAKRRGRGLVIGPQLREAVWELYQAYERERRRESRESWAALRSEARTVQRARKLLQFDHVIVDEAQDLSPEALGLMADICRTPEGIYFTADLKQSIYARGYTWANADPRLQFTGRTHLLKRNYRSTQEIDWAALDLLIGALENGEDLDPADLERSDCVHHGPLPVLVKETTAEDEASWIVRFLKQMGTHLRLPPHASAVLVPDNRIAQELAEALTGLGLPSKHIKGKDLSLKAREVSVMTFASAKGLEFPMVAIAGLRPGSYPSGDTSDLETMEAFRAHVRQLYVACTRAMRGLLVLGNAHSPHPCLKDLRSGNWNLIKQGAPRA